MQAELKQKKTLIIFILKIENSKFKLSKQIKLPLKLIFSKNILADIAIKAIILNFYKKKKKYRVKIASFMKIMHFEATASWQVRAGLPAYLGFLQTEVIGNLETIFLKLVSISKF